MPCTILLNGHRRTLEISQPVSLAALVIELGFKADRVAIERNGTIVSRPLWNDVLLEEEDRIELVQFVGGGAPISAESNFSQRSP